MAGNVAQQETLFFVEKVSFMEQLAQVVAAEDASVTAPIVKRLCEVLDRYQEQSHLLDPHLEGMVQPIMARVRSTLRAWHLAREMELEAAQKAGATAFPLQLYHNPVLHHQLQLVYALCKTRGYKHIIKLFPHEVADVEPCLTALACQDATDHNTWETRYVLLLWLSILVLIPFDLTTVDSTVGHGTTNSGSAAGGIIDRITALCQSYLSDPGAVRVAAAVCLSRLLTRPDMDRHYLRVYCSWAADTLAVCTARTDGPALDAADAAADGSDQHIPTSLSSGAGAGACGAGNPGNPSALSSSIASRVFLATGVLTSVVEIAKHGHREVLKEVLSDLFARVSAIASGGTATGPAAGRSGGLRSSPLLRKLTVKLAARTGLTFMPPRVVSWRYQRGQRSLLDNLSSAGVAAAKQRAEKLAAGRSSSGGAGTAALAVSASGLVRTGNTALLDSSIPEDDAAADDADVPDGMAEVIDVLLNGLRDSDTVVRWSAAKGIGRVTGRLPAEFADDVVVAVLQLLAPQEGDGAWHGGCLALAELTRRGLLLPSRLAEVTPLVLQALAYDVRRGAHSVGQHVRDAACYVCWAFARAYAPAIMRPHVVALAQGMLVTALFDREVNCRRAASAAFQENVGRQGHENFPNGITILTAADYFTLGNRSHAYLQVAPVVAAFPLYRYALLDHLLRVKLKHWDRDVRELAAKGLARLCRMDPEWAIKVALPFLLPLTCNADLFTRHGATLGIAELVLALSQVPAKLPTAILDEVRNVVVKAEKARVYMGRGGEMVRAAMCRLIECQCLAGHTLSNKAALRLLQTVDDCLKHPNDVIQAMAVASLRALAAHSFHTADTATLDRLPRTYVSRLADENPAVRRGMSLALGALPRSLLLGSSVADLDKVLDALIRATQPEKQIARRDAETRRNAAMGLADVVSVVGFGRQTTASAAEWAAVGYGGSAVNSKAGGDGLSPAQLGRVWDALLYATRDYAADNRGDVGSWVRKAAVESAERVVVYLQSALYQQMELQRVFKVLSDATQPLAQRLAAVDALEACAANDASGAAGAAAQQVEAAQQVSGYGNITGYGAGTRLLPSYVKPDNDRTVNGLRRGQRVSTVYGEGRITAVAAAGALTEVTFGTGTLGYVYFPYKVAILHAEKLKPAPSFASSHATAAAVAARLAHIPVVTVADDLSTFITAAMATAGVNACLRQVTEKLDLLRAVAGDVLCRVLHLPAPLPPLSGLPHRHRLESVFPPNQARVATGSGAEDFGTEDAETADAADADGSTAADTEGHSASGAAAPAATGPSQGSSSIQWSIPHHCFPRVVQLLGLPEYSSALIEGIVTSVGGLSESVVKHSSMALSAWARDTRKAGDAAALAVVGDALLTQLKPKPKLPWELAGGDSHGASEDELGAAIRPAASHGFDPSLSRWFKEILGTDAGTGTSHAKRSGAGAGAGAGAGGSSGSSDINNTHKVEVRVVVPTLRTLDALLTYDAFDLLHPPAHSWGGDLLALVRRRMVIAKEDVHRVMASAAVLLGLLSFPAPVRSDGLICLLDLLGHPFPRVRKTTAEKLYIKLLTLDDVVPAENMDAVITVLTETPWDSELARVLEPRDSLYGLLQLRMPEARMGYSEDDKALAATGGRGKGGDTGEDDFSSYGALAREAGY